MTMFEKKDAGGFSGDIGHAIQLEVKADEKTGEFEGYGAIFGNEDRGGDTILRGAFSGHLAKTKLSRIKLLYQHQPDKVIGHYTEIREDEKGLFVRGQLALGVQQAREVHELMQVGALDSLSIGYKTIRSERNEGDWTRKLIELELWECSVVTFPMNDAALVSQTKSAPKTEKDSDKFLREAWGLSRKEATAFTNHGFKGLMKLLEAGSDGIGGSDLMSELERARSAFQG